MGLPPAGRHQQCPIPGSAVTNTSWGAAPPSQVTPRARCPAQGSRHSSPRAPQQQGDPHKASQKHPPGLSLPSVLITSRGWNILSSSDTLPGDPVAPPAWDQQGLCALWPLHYWQLCAGLARCFQLLDCSQSLEFVVCCCCSPLITSNRFFSSR